MGSNRGSIYSNKGNKPSPRTVYHEGKQDDQIQLNAITESLAIIGGHTEITQEDIDAIVWLSKWINYDFKEI